MKQVFTILLLLFILLYGKTGYDLFTEPSLLESATSGSLSDIAEKVIAIPLQSPDMYTIDRVRSVQKEGDNFFLINNDILYRFDTSGRFICRVTNPDVITVAGYLIDPIERRLIVMGNENDVHFYSFTGKLLNAQKFATDSLHQRIHAATIYNNHIWTTEECSRYDENLQTHCIEKQVVEYDSSFRKIQSHKLVSAGLYNNRNFESSCDFQLGVSEDTGTVYAYSPAMQPEKLLLDTLRIQRRQQLYDNKLASHNQIGVFPLRFGQRYWISSYDNPDDPSANYTFCFDQNSSKSWYVKGGFNDNFYHTGSVPQLKPMDIYSNSYYFCKSGKEVEKAFPKSKHSGNAVLFVVQLKV